MKSKLCRVGNVEIQLDLFYDYRTNVDLYPRFQEYFRERKPPTLIVWGAAEFHLLETGHFALEDKGAEIAALMRDFLDRKVAVR